jgi:hypothetical protein
MSSATSGVIVSETANAIMPAASSGLSHHGWASGVAQPSRRGWGRAVMVDAKKLEARLGF